MEFVYVVMTENEDHEPKLRVYSDDKLALQVAEDEAIEWCGKGNYSYDIILKHRHVFVSNNDSDIFTVSVLKLSVK